MKTLITIIIVFFILKLIFKLAKKLIFWVIIIAIGYYILEKFL
ncbi:hypothetical protein [Leptotrichia sp. oral taxon 847]|nr:hypothetical protein [Leptotrichia sp. oral taxon 847]